MSGDLAAWIDFTRQGKPYRLPTRVEQFFYSLICICPGSYSHDEYRWEDTAPPESCAFAQEETYTELPRDWTRGRSSSWEQ